MVMEHDSERRRSDEKLAELIEKDRLIPPADLQALLEEIDARSGEADVPPLARLIVERGYAREEEVRLLTERIRFRPGTPAVAAGFPRRLGAYELLEIIGSGAMGAVVKARQLHMDRIVALKILSGSMARDRGYIERFLREARAAGALNHGNIVKVYEVGEAGGFYYFSMEYVEGLTAGKLIAKRGRVPVREATEIVDQVASALEHAEAHGIVHRDVKPDNIILDAHGRARLADLGLAKRLAGARDPQTGLRAEGGSDGAATRDGVTMGTPFYMSLEQARSPRKVDRRSDIYSLGATFYHMVTGRVPFDGDSAADILTNAARQPLVRPERIRPDILPAVGDVIARMMAKAPEARFQSAGELRAELRRVKRVVAGGGAPRPPAGMLAAFKAPLVACVGFLVLAVAHALVSWAEGSRPPALLPPPPAIEEAGAAPSLPQDSPLPDAPPVAVAQAETDPAFDLSRVMSDLGRAFVASGLARGVLMAPAGSEERGALFSEILSQAREVEERTILLLEAGAFETAREMLDESAGRWEGLAGVEERPRALREKLREARRAAKAERRRAEEYERLSSPPKALAAERRYEEASRAAQEGSMLATDAQAASALGRLAEDYAALEKLIRALIEELNSPGKELSAGRYLDGMPGGVICGADREWVRVRLSRRMETARRWSSLAEEEFSRLVWGVARTRSERWRKLVKVLRSPSAGEGPGGSSAWARRKEACEVLDGVSELLDGGELRRAARLLWESWGLVGNTRRALAALELACAGRPFHCRAVEVYPGRFRLSYGFDSFEEAADWRAEGAQLVIKAGAIESPGEGESFLELGPSLLGDLELELAWIGGPIAVSLSLQGPVVEVPRVEGPHVLRLRNSPDGASWQVEGTELKGELDAFLLSSRLWITMRGPSRVLSARICARFSDKWLAEALARREEKARASVQAALDSGRARELQAAGLYHLDCPALAARAWSRLAATPGDPGRASKARGFAEVLLDLARRRGENSGAKLE